MSLCILAAGKLLTLAATAFTLTWTHSVEKTAWFEQWQVVDGGLKVVEARVQGSGAGMDPPEGAVLTDKGWEYRPQVPPLDRLILAASGATGSGWEFCTETGCRTLAVEAGAPIEIWSAPNGACAVPP
jgi:hypothetical protein